MKAIIAFTSAHDGYFTVFLLDLAAGEVTDDAFDDFDQAWSFACSHSTNINLDPSVPARFRAEVAA